MKKGFTLIELLIVIGIIGILVVAVAITLNPLQRFQDARNRTREAHLLVISNGILANVSKNRGSFVCDSGAIPAVDTSMAVGAGNYDICSCLVPNFISGMPVDPDPNEGSYTNCAAYDTGYTIRQNAANSSIILSAPNAELGETIVLTR